MDNPLIIMDYDSYVLMIIMILIITIIIIIILVHPPYLSVDEHIS